MHYTVLVVGENPEKQLQPFHEYESTGIYDEYVKDIDVTQEYIDTYNNGTRTMVVDNKGNIYNTWDEICYRELKEEEKEEYKHCGSGAGGGIIWSSRSWSDGIYRTKIYELPEGFVEKEMSYKELYTFEEYLKEIEGFDGDNMFIECGQDIGENLYQYIILDENKEISHIIKRTNPSGKWDWYLLGGRWTGFFKLKEGKNGIKGEPSLAYPKEAGDYVDQALKGDIDFEGMKKKVYEESIEIYENFAKEFPNGIIPKIDVTWEQVYKDENIKGYDKKQEYYNSQKALKIYNEIAQAKIKNQEYDNIFMHLNISDFQVSKEEYANRCANETIITYAVLKDGEWYSRKDNKKEWNEIFNELLETVSDDTLLSLYDYHT